MSLTINRKIARKKIFPIIFLFIFSFLFLGFVSAAWEVNIAPQAIGNINSSDYWDNLDTPDDIPGSEFWYNQTTAGSDTREVSNASISLYTNNSFSQIGNATYALIGSGGNASWNESYADGLYAPISVVDTDTHEATNSSISLYTNNSFSQIGNATYALIGSGGNSSFNQSWTDSLYAGIQWAYNQTLAVFSLSILNDTYALVGSSNASFNQSWTDSLYGSIDFGYNETASILSKFNESWSTTIPDTDTHEATNSSISLYTNNSFSQIGNATYALIGSGGNASWNESYANSLYLPHTEDTHEVSNASISLYTNNSISQIGNATYADIIYSYNETDNILTKFNASWSSSSTDTHEATNASISLYTNNSFSQVGNATYELIGAVVDTDTHEATNSSISLYTNNSFSQVGNATYALIGATGNASWNESYADTLYLYIGIEYLNSTQANLTYRKLSDTINEANISDLSHTVIWDTVFNASFDQRDQNSGGTVSNESISLYTNNSFSQVGNATYELIGAVVDTDTHEATNSSISLYTNNSFSQVGNATYALIGSGGNASWNESYADTLYGNVIYGYNETDNILSKFNESWSTSGTDTHEATNASISLYTNNSFSQIGNATYELIGAVVDTDTHEISNNSWSTISNASYLNTTAIWNTQFNASFDHRDQTGSGGNVFDQDLNQTFNVAFMNLTLNGTLINVSADDASLKLYARDHSLFGNDNGETIELWNRYGHSKAFIGWYGMDNETSTVPEAIGWIGCHLNSTNGDFHRHCSWETLDNSTGSPSINSHFEIEYGSNVTRPRVAFPGADVNFISEQKLYFGDTFGQAYIVHKGAAGDLELKSNADVLINATQLDINEGDIVKVDDIFSISGAPLDVKPDTSFRIFPGAQTTRSINFVDNGNWIEISANGATDIEFLENVNVSAGNDFCIDGGNCLSTVSGSSSSSWLFGSNLIYNDTSGIQVGIGTNTPGSTLDIGSGGNITIDDGSWIGKNVNNAFKLSSTSNAGINSGNSIYLSLDADGGESGKAFIIETDGEFGSGTELMRVEDTGNVGIGTGIPSDKFNVAGGDVNFSSSGTTTMVIENTDANNAYIEMRTPAGEWSWLAFWRADTEHYRIGEDSSNQFFISSQVLGENLLVGDSDGDIGIGTDQPFVTLDVGGRLSVGNEPSNFNLNTELVEVPIVVQEARDIGSNNTNGSLMFVGDEQAGDAVGFAIDIHGNNDVDLHIGHKDSGDTSFQTAMVVQQGLNVHLENNLNVTNNITYIDCITFRSGGEICSA